MTQYYFYYACAATHSKWAELLYIIILHNDVHVHVHDNVWYTHASVGEKRPGIYSDSSRLVCLYCIIVHNAQFMKVDYFFFP